MTHKSLLSRVKFGVFVICVIVLSGCASSIRTPVSSDNLINFRPDCKKKNEQLTFLYSILPTKQEEQTAAFQVSMLGLFTSDYETKRMMADGSMSFMIKQNIDWVKQACRG